MKLFKSLPLVCLAFASNFASAQTTISYASLNVSPCNVFGSATIVSGYTHTSVKGRVFYDISASAINLLGKGTQGTMYQFNYPTYAGHVYRVTITSREELNPTGSVVAVGLTALQTAGNACNPETIATSAFPVGALFHVYTDLSNFTDYTNNITATQDNGYVAVKAYVDPNYFTSNTYDIGTYISKITITDLTPSPGTFSITSNVSSRQCMNTDPITFTLNHLTNPSNVTATSYRVYPQPGQWTESNTYYDVPATGPNNSGTITLHPLATATNLKVSANVTAGGLSYTINPLTITNTLPGGITSIIGPSSITCIGAGTQSAQYSISIIGFPTTYVIPTWTIAPYFSYYSGETVSYNANGPLYTTVTTPYSNSSAVVAPWSGAQGLLNVNLQMCGLSTDVSKVITFESESAFNFPRPNPSAGNSDQNLSVSFSPNPVSDIAHLQFEQNIENGSFEITGSNGNQIKKGSIANLSKMDIDLSEVKSGVYFINVSDGKQHIVQKFVKK